MNSFVKVLDTSGLSVVFTDETNGMGDLLMGDALHTIQKLYPGKIFSNCLEWCSGPGFLGFTLLGAGLCERIVLSDIFEPAEKIIKRTVINNGLDNKVKFYCSDCFDNIPETEKFDFIIANPPHFSFSPYAPHLSDPRKFKDEGWNIHRKFFSQVYNYLTDDGKILLLECSWGSNLDIFKDMIEQNNLKISNHFPSEKLFMDIWYLEVTKNDNIKRSD